MVISAAFGIGTTIAVQFERTVVIERMVFAAADPSVAVSFLTVTLDRSSVLPAQPLWIQQRCLFPFRDVAQVEINEPCTGFTVSAQADNGFVTVFYRYAE